MDSAPPTFPACPSRCPSPNASLSEFDVGLSRLVLHTKLAEKVARFDDMLHCLLQIIEQRPELTVDERILLNIAYKGNLVPRRTSLRSLNSVLLNLHKEEHGHSDIKSATKIRAVNRMIEKITGEIEEICNEVTFVLKSKVRRTDYQSEVFYGKMVGDFYRYKAEIQKGTAQSISASLSASSYQTALEISTAFLSPADNTHLGLVLNYSVCMYELLGQKTTAIEFANKHFENGVNNLDSVPQGQYRDSTTVLQIIRDNMLCWEDYEAELAEDLAEQNMQDVVCEDHSVVPMDVQTDLSE